VQAKPDGWLKPSAALADEGAVNPDVVVARQ
jgi:hypothetical protein